MCESRGQAMTEGIRAQKARSLFESGYNCAQSVLAAFDDVTGLDRQTALRLASSFGAGIGRLREVCGAVSAMAMIAGLLFGSSDPGAEAEKAAHYARIQALLGEFRQTNGTLICRELLGKPPGADSPVPDRRTPKYYAARPCANLVAQAAEIMEAYIEAHGLPGSGEFRQKEGE